MRTGRLLALAGAAALTGWCVLAWLESRERKQAGSARYGADFNAYQSAGY